MSAPFTIAIAKSGPNFIVSWAGGPAPFQLLKCLDLGVQNWLPVGGPTIATSKVVANDAPAAFFRVQGAIPLLDVDLTKPNTHLVWQVPDLT